MRLDLSVLEAEAEKIIRKEGGQDTWRISAMCALSSAISLKKIAELLSATKDGERG